MTSGFLAGYSHLPASAMSANRAMQFDRRSIMPSLLIVSDMRLFRDGLAVLLARRESVRVVGAATNADEAVHLTRKLQPDVIVLDQALPESLELPRALAAFAPRLRIVAIGVHDRGEESVLAFAEAGVAGYVPRDASTHDLVAAVEAAVRGEVHCSPQIAGAIARRLAWRAAAVPDTAHPTLTARELEVVRLVAAGRSNKEIAAALGIEVPTVKNHVHNLLEKLNLRRRAEVAARLGAMAGASSGSRAAPPELRAPAL